MAATNLLPAPDKTNDFSVKQQIKMGEKNSKLIDTLPHQFVFADCNSSIPTLFQMVPNFTPISQVLRDTDRPCFSLTPCSLLHNYTVCPSTLLAPGSVKAGVLTLQNRRRQEDFFILSLPPGIFCIPVSKIYLLKNSDCENITISSQFKLPFFRVFFSPLAGFILSSILERLKWQTFL